MGLESALPPPPPIDQRSKIYNNRTNQTERHSTGGGGGPFPAATGRRQNASRKKAGERCSCCSSRKYLSIEVSIEEAFASRNSQYVLLGTRYPLSKSSTYWQRGREGGGKCLFWKHATSCAFKMADGDGEPKGGCGGGDAPRLPPPPRPPPLAIAKRRLGVPDCACSAVGSERRCSVMRPPTESLQS